MKKIFLTFWAVLFAGTLFAQRKNVLFILVDDLKPLLGAYGDPYAVTPQIDRLAARGFLFEHAYAQQAVCAPSRASMLTGLRPDYTRVWDLKTRIRDRVPDVITLPQLFRENGYTTYGIGKVFDPRSVDHGHDRRSWSVPYVQPFHLMDYEPLPKMGYYQLPAHVEKVRFYEAIAASRGLKGNAAKEFVRKNYKPSTERCDVPDEAYLDGALASEAVKKLELFSKEGKPFVLMVGFKKPHLPFVAPERYWQLYDHKKIPLARFQRHAKGSPQIAYHNSPELRSYSDIPEAFNEMDVLDTEKQRELIHGYYACVSYIDAQIGKLLDQLEKTGLDKNTIVVLWGDHGWHLGDHGLWTKHTNFEQATRLPLIIASPGNEPGRTEVPVESVDIFPTVCELAGLDVPEDVQGESLVPLMEGETRDKDFAISQWPTRKGKGGMGYSIRTVRYRLTEWYDTYRSTLPRQGSRPVAVELYDYQEDPLETKNLAHNKRYAQVLQEMQDKLHVFLDTQRKEQPPQAEMTEQEEIPGHPRGPALRDLVARNIPDGNVFVGATFYYADLGTPKTELLASQFSYTTPANAAKQSVVHPRPGVWSWKKIDAMVRFAQSHDMVVRLHAPVSPQCSKWAKDDRRTPEELMQNMTEYVSALCKHFHGNPTVRWMDVVNETVDDQGRWFGPKEGTDHWENPWLTIGLNKDGIPRYIDKAFELATRLADPNIRLVYNQHLAMQPVMWEKVKATVLYLKKKGYRVDAIGWQAHLRERDGVGLDPAALAYLDSLISWAHAHGMEFHITEFDFRQKGTWNAEKAQRQAIVYANVLKVLLRHRDEGVVAWNTWGIADGNTQYTDGHRYMFDEQLRAKPAYYAVQQVLAHPDELEPVFPVSRKMEENAEELLVNGGFEEGLRGWKYWGGAEVTRDGARNGEGNCLILPPRSGVKQEVELQKGGHYVFTGWLRCQEGDMVNMKVVLPGQEKPLVKKVSSSTYVPARIAFTMPSSGKVTVYVQKWTPAPGKAFVDDLSLHVDLTTGK